MSAIEDFSDNQNLSDKEPLSLDEVMETYIRKNGTEQAQGFLDAMAYFSQQLNDCFIKKTVFKKCNGRSTPIPDCDVVVPKKVDELKQQYLTFLSSGKKSISQWQVAYPEKPEPL